MVDTGVVILAGGKSKRMGTPKAMLPFGDEFLLQRIVRRLTPLGSPVVVVSARDQTLPDLPGHVTIAVDERPDHGPMEGLRVGLGAFGSPVEWAFVTGCDLPFLSSRFVERLAEPLGDKAEIAAPKLNEEIYPLPALYQTALLSRVEALCNAGSFRMKDLLQNSKTELIDIARLPSNQPGELFNVNTPEQLATALSYFNRVADDD